ncbi:MAG: hypothetical protein HWD61_12005 [Parachlamydiaceae bacterium]|nr:MAG: hypothetical protein HWD61_12005 [Parachlamydiaceae bacterium]
MLVLEQSLEVVSLKLEERLLKICRTFPIHRELFERVLVKSQDPNWTTKEKQTHRIKFIYLTNQALIDGLYFLEMSPLSLVQDMAALIANPFILLQIKENLIHLYNSLIQSPYYHAEINSDQFKAASEAFFNAIKILKLRAGIKFIKKTDMRRVIF